jgi:hypothetical protein
MSSLLKFKEQMSSLKKEENQYLGKLEEIQKKSGSMSDAIDDLIAFCKLQLAKEELAEKMIKELKQEKLVKNEIALIKEELMEDELSLTKELAQDELVQKLDKD